MKFGATLLLSLLLIAAPACGGGGGSSPSAPSVAASFTPDQPTPGPKTAAMAQGPRANDVVGVEVTLTGSTNVTAAVFEIVYDASHTSCVGFTDGTAFEQGASHAVLYQVDWTSQPGRIFVTVARTGSDGATSVAGTMVVVGLQFRVKQAGVYPLQIQNSVVYDGQPVPQPVPGVSWFAGAVTGS